MLEAISREHEINLTFNTLIDMEENTREFVLGLLAPSQKKKIFASVFKLEELLYFPFPTASVKNKEKFELLKEFPTKRFWDFGRLKLPKENKLAVFQDILVSCKGDVVKIGDKGPKFFITKATDGNSTNTRRSLILDGFEDPIQIDMLVAYTFLEYRLDDSLFSKTVIHKNWINFDDSWHNLAWDK